MLTGVASAFDMSLRRFVFLSMMFTITAIISFESGLFYAHVADLQVSMIVTTYENSSHSRNPSRQTSWWGAPHQIGTCRSTRGLCAALEEGMVGSLRCGERDVTVLFGIPLPLRIYQFYESRKDHVDIHDCTNRLYQGLAFAPDVRRADNADVDASLYLPLVHNINYQSNLAEYSGIYGLLASGRIDDSPEPYIAFQSWRAQGMGYALQCEAERTLVRNVKKAWTEQQDTFFYWAAPNFNGISFNFYGCCEHFHGKECTNLWQTVFGKLFAVRGAGDLVNGVPPMPGTTEDWAYLTQFAMPKTRLKEYLEFAALFFTVLEDSYYKAFINQWSCPISNWDPKLEATIYAKRHCFSYLMERLVNIWVYHVGMPFMYIDPNTGSMVETHHVANRTMIPWFTDGSIAKSKSRILAKVSRRNNRRIYDRLLRPHTVRHALPK